MASVCWSTTLTKPGGSPFGDTSIAPDALTLATTMNGHLSIQVRQCTSMWSMIFATWLGKSGPKIALISAAVLIVIFGWYMTVPPRKGETYYGHPNTTNCHSIG